VILNSRRDVSIPSTSVTKLVSGRSGNYVISVSQSQHTRADPFDCLSTHATYNRNTFGTCAADDGPAASELQRFRTEGFAPRNGGTKVQSHVLKMKEAEVHRFYFGRFESRRKPRFEYRREILYIAITFNRHCIDAYRRHLITIFCHCFRTIMSNDII